MGRLKNPRHEEFCRLFVFGNPRHDPKDPDSPEETRHLHRESYEAAGYKARGESARVLGYRLLQRVDIQERIEELREEVVNVARARRFRWAQLFPDAQEYLWNVVTGREEAESARVSAAKEIIAQDQGPLNLRFRDPKTGKERTGIPVFVLGVDDEEEDDDDQGAGTGG